MTRIPCYAVENLTAERRNRHAHCQNQQKKDRSTDCASTVYRWMRGESLPGTERLYQLSQLFGVDIGDILVLEEPVVLHAWKKEASRGQNAGQTSQP